MADIVFVALTLAFFGLCALYVRACEAIVRSTDTPPAVTDSEDAGS